MTSLKLCGFQKTTLLDYPGYVACTLFLGGCNFRCPFCHNSGILDDSADESITMDELMDFLKKRKGILEGICITGGEPTLHPLPLFRLLDQIKALGYRIKLDTNGSRPDILKQLCADGLIDCVAMDIKAGRTHYGKVCGLDGFLFAPIDQSVRWLKEGHIPFEFRTTVVKGLHDIDDFNDISLWLAGDSPYYLQEFVPSRRVPDKNLAAFSSDEMELFLAAAKRFLPNARIRGIA